MEGAQVPPNESFRVLVAELYCLWLGVRVVGCLGSMYSSCALLLAKASGRPVLPGADTPYLDRALACVCGVGVFVVSCFSTT
jgi:hypothetical protein